VTTVLAFAAEHGVETMPVHTAVLKKWTTGKGNANKEAMIEAARARGWEPADDNEADAQLLLEYSIENLNIPESWGKGKPHGKSKQRDD